MVLELGVGAGMKGLGLGLGVGVGGGGWVRPSGLSVVPTSVIISKCALIIIRSMMPFGTG